MKRNTGSRKRKEEGGFTPRRHYPIYCVAGDDREAAGRSVRRQMI
jgi:hypothetical protein